MLLQFLRPQVQNQGLSMTVLTPEALGEILVFASSSFCWLLTMLGLRNILTLCSPVCVFNSAALF